MKCGAYFSPGTECKTALQDLMRGAKNSLDICVFTISDNDLTEEIVQAHNRGVKVRIVTDNYKSEDRGSDVHFLLREGVPLVMDSSRNHMHHKYMIVDGQYLANGSFNWTRSATKYNQENILVLDDREMISQFQATFDHLWSTFKVI